MNKNWIFLLGFLGLLGLLGFFTDNSGFYGFFGFFGFFGFKKIIPDERFEQNINRAAKKAFISSLIIFPIVTVSSAFVKNPLIYAFGYSINFAVLVFVFAISLSLYDN